MTEPRVKVGITASHDGGNIELISQSEPVITGRTAKVTVTVHVKPGEDTSWCMRHVIFHQVLQLHSNIVIHHQCS